MNEKQLILPHVNKGLPFTVYYEIDRFINEILVNKEYELLIKGLRLFNREDLIIVDLGCNIGTFSLYMYDKAKEIHAVDFSSGCISLLNQTIERNGFTKIKAYQKAISGDGRKVKVTSLGETNGGNTIYGTNEEIESQTLSSFFDEVGIKHIDLLKLDVEGTEKEILGSDEFKKVMDKIDIIIGEYHGGEITDIFPRLGYNYVLIERNFIAWHENRTSD